MKAADLLLPAADLLHHARKHLEAGVKRLFVHVEVELMVTGFAVCAVHKERDFAAMILHAAREERGVFRAAEVRFLRDRLDFGDSLCHFAERIDHVGIVLHIAGRAHLADVIIDAVGNGVSLDDCHGLIAM